MSLILRKWWDANWFRFIEQVDKCQMTSVTGTQNLLTFHAMTPRVLFSHKVAAKFYWKPCDLIPVHCVRTCQSSRVLISCVLSLWQS